MIKRNIKVSWKQPTMYLNCPRKIKEPQGNEDQVEKSWSPYYCMRYRCPFEPWNVKNQTLLSLMYSF